MIYLNVKIMQFTLPTLIILTTLSAMTWCTLFREPGSPAFQCPTLKIWVDPGDEDIIYMHTRTIESISFSEWKLASTGEVITEQSFPLTNGIDITGLTKTGIWN